MHSKLQRYCVIFIHIPHPGSMALQFPLTIHTHSFAIHTYVNSSTHTYTHICIHTYIYVNIDTYLNTPNPFFIHTYIHTYTYTHLYIHACMHTSSCVKGPAVFIKSYHRGCSRLYTCMYVCMCIPQRM